MTIWLHKCSNPATVIEIEVNGCNPNNSSEDNSKASHNTSFNLVEWQLEEYKKQQKKILDTQIERYERADRISFKTYLSVKLNNLEGPRNQQNDKRYRARKHENQQQTKNQQC